MKWRLACVLMCAGVMAVVSPSVAAVTNAALVQADTPGAQTPPQVFVRDERGNVHAPRPDEDPNAALYDADGDPLSFTLEKWHDGNGSIDIEADPDDPAGDRVSLSLHRLIAFGHYSIFVRTDASDGPHFAPLDGSGIANNFDAHQDGSASVTIATSDHVPAGAWIVVIYHSDAQDHGNSPGEMTHTAHQQLVFKLP